MKVDVNVHPVFNITLLRKAEPDEIKERPQPSHPEPEIDKEGEEAFEVEEILDSRLYRRKLEYLIKWKDYGPEWNLWVPEEDAQGAKDLIKNFHKKHPNAPRRISSTAFDSLPFHKYSRPRKGRLYNWHTNQFVGTMNLSGGVMYIVEMPKSEWYD